MKITPLLALLACIGISACGESARQSPTSTLSASASSVERGVEEPNGIRTSSSGVESEDPFASLGNAFTSTNETTNETGESSEPVPASVSDTQVFRALPKRNRVSPPTVGSWHDNAFVEGSGGACEALHASYVKSSNKLVNTIEDESGLAQPEERTVTFEEKVEFVVILAGDQRSQIRSQIVEQLEADGWMPGGSTVISGDGNDDVRSWQNDNQVVYLAEAGGLLLYARETNGEHVTGSGLGTSYGAQIIVLFQASYNP